MIVPFFFDLDEYTNEKPKFLIWYYKFAEFAYKNNFKIIAQEDFVVDPNIYKAKNYWAVSDEAKNYYLFEVLEKKQLDKITFIITKNQEKEIIEEYKKNGDPALMNLSMTSKKLEKIIENFILENKNVKAFLVWIANPTLSKVAKKYNIEIINMELSTLRYPTYNARIGYFSFNNKYNSSFIKKSYSEFLKKREELLLFSRKELLSLFLIKDDLHYIDGLYRIPEYNFGYALGLKNDNYEKTYSDINHLKIIKELSDKKNKNELLIRPHPANKISLSNYNIDNSANTKEWICKCKNIVYNISNTGYEAMLFGRGAIPLSNCLPTAFGEKYDLSYIPDEVASITKLNFITFGIYAPVELMFTKEYIEWRLTKPSIVDIYNKNLDYILKEKDLSVKELYKKNESERVRVILKKVHNLSENEIDEILNYGFYRTYNNAVKQNNHQVSQIKHLKNKNEELVNTINDILNSKSWKITKPIRIITEHLKK